jgi:hypothetical protein
MRAAWSHTHIALPGRLGSGPALGPKTNNGASLNAGEPRRSPEGTAMRAALSHTHIALPGRLRSGPALGPAT